MNNSYKVILIGDKKTGKTAYLDNIRYSTYNNEYIPTMGVNVHPISLNTNYGEYIFKIWDTAGDDKYGGMREGYYIEADACIVFYTENSDHVKTDKLLKKFLEINPDAEVVIVWSKYDQENERNYIENMSYTPAGYKYIRRNNYGCFQVSVLSRFNLFEPEKYLLRKLTKKVDLYFSEHIMSSKL